MTKLQLYRKHINQLNNALKELVEINVDEDTGELSNEVYEQLNAIEVQKEDIVRYATLTFNEYRVLHKTIKDEIRRLNDLAKRYERTMEGFKKMLLANVPEGEKIESDLYRISWRKSSSVEIDQDYLAENLLGEDEFLKELESKYKDLVKVSRTLKKKEAKDLYKKTGTLPKGLKFVEDKQNIQIQ